MFEVGFHELSLIKQCDYLQTNHINNKSNRKQLIKDLISNEPNFVNLNSLSYHRIHIKYILSQFHKESEKLKYSQNVDIWTGHDIILSFVSHLIDASASDESPDKKATASTKVWEFVDYLRRYFNDNEYDGKQFLSALNSKDKNSDGSHKPAKGFGLQMMKNVCHKYSLKSGPFSKVKKQCNIWAQQIHKQSQGIAIPQKKVYLHLFFFFVRICVYISIFCHVL